MRVARVQAQAKLNLILTILPTRDAGGYHELMTWFHRIDLADEIVVRAGGASRTLACAGPQMPAGGLGRPEDNLAYRAAVEFSQRAGWPDGFAIEVTKRIPVGGGLGGGSADAGGVLRALNAIAPKPLPADEIWSAGCALGSDVPFLAGETLDATGMGRGTQLKEGIGKLIPARHVLIVKPQFSIGTADAYRWLDEHRAQHGWNPKGGPDPGNDFEPVMEARFPQIQAIRARLREKGAQMARLAGSGSCVFGLFDELPPASLDLGFDVQLIQTRLSSNVVQVEVLE